MAEGDLKSEEYNENKDLVACPQCSRQEKYKNFPKREFKANEVGNRGHQMSITIIYGAKNESNKIPQDNRKGGSRCEKCNLASGGLTIITHYYTNFTKRVWHFGLHCPCAEQFKRENQQTCGQCQKQEWPDMAKGWLLDYELKLAFCSPTCHINYCQAKWEEESLNNQQNQTRPDYSQWARQAQFFPPQLSITLSDGSQSQNSSNNSTNQIDQEATKQELLYYRKSLEELKKQLESSKQKPSEQLKPNEVKHQQEQVNYLLTLHQNTQQQVENAYQAKYGKTALNSLLANLEKQEQINQQPKKNYWPLIIGIGLVGGGLVIGLIIFLVNRQKQSK